eukprot:10202276-Lingulodinium_polyedra.AAC.1
MRAKVLCPSQCLRGVPVEARILPGKAVAAWRKSCATRQWAASTVVPEGSGGAVAKKPWATTPLGHH